MQRIQSVVDRSAGRSSHLFASSTRRVVVRSCYCLAARRFHDELALRHCIGADVLALAGKDIFDEIINIHVHVPLLNGLHNNRRSYKAKNSFCTTHDG